MLAKTLEYINMSSIPNGGGNQFVSAGGTYHATVTWNNGGWQGNTLVEAQPLNTGAGLTVVQGNIGLNSNGHYGFAYSVKDNGQNYTYFNVQVSSN